MTKPSDELIRAMAEDYKAGLSFAVIGAKFGLSRSSVAGHVFRNRDLFPKRGSEPSPMRKGRDQMVNDRRDRRIEARRRPVPVAGADVASIDEWSADVSAILMTDPVRFADRRAGQCGYPIERTTERHGPNMLVCGGGTPAGSYYCAFHRGIAYRPKQGADAA